ncbi:hypothetical protein GCM10020254_87310 [Streptomyces goshikiensis]
MSPPERILPPTSDASSVASDAPRVLQPASQAQPPWDDGNKVADLVLKKMSASQRDVLLERLLAAHGSD